MNCVNITGVYCICCAVVCDCVIIVCMCVYVCVSMHVLERACNRAQNFVYQGLVLLPINRDISILRNTLRKLIQIYKLTDIFAYYKLQ